MDEEPQFDRNVVFGDIEDSNPVETVNSRPYSLWKVIGTAGLFLVLFLILFLFIIKDGVENTVVKSEIDELRQKVANLPSNGGQQTDPGIGGAPRQFSVDQRHEADLRSLEKLTLRKAALAAFKTKVQNLSNLSDSYDTQYAELTTQIDSLLGNEAGKRIAAAESLIREFIAIRAQANQAESLSDDTSGFISSLTELITKAELKPDLGYEPSQEIIDQLVGRTTKLTSSLRNLEKLSAALQSLSRRSTDTSGSVLLNESIRAIEAADAEQLAQRLTKELSDLREKNFQELKQATADRLASENDVKIGVEKALSEQAKILGQQRVLEIQAEGDAELARKKAEAERAQLLAEFNASQNEIRSYLAPFLANGTSLRGPNEGEGPASFSYIQGLGALDDNSNGQNSLMQLGAGGIYSAAVGRKYEDRPRGGFPQWDGGMLETGMYVSYTNHVKKAQQLLRKYGPLLVEKKWLAK